jgi:ABC-type sugar transport system ATPase subunit
LESKELLIPSKKQWLVNYMLKIRNLSKKYGNIEVLKAVNIDIKQGEIHGLVGANGSGKSTLLNILFGNPVIHSTGGYSGDIYIDGKREIIKTPSDAIRIGIGMIHQEFALINSLNVAENIKINNENTHKFSDKIVSSELALIDKKKNLKDASKVLGELGVDIDPKINVLNLSVNIKQFVEIAREIEKSSLKILMLDEPTSVLGNEDIQKLNKTLKRLSEKGKTIIYISHRLEEVFELCDSVTVLRDGELINTYRKIVTDADASTGINTDEKATSSTCRKSNFINQVDTRANINEIATAVVATYINDGSCTGIGADANVNFNPNENAGPDVNVDVNSCTRAGDIASMGTNAGSRENDFSYNGKDNIVTAFDIDKIAEDMIGHQISMACRENYKKSEEEVCISFKDFVVNIPGEFQSKINMEVHNGEILGITGLSGHGKSAIGYGIMGLHKSHGKVTFNGREIDNHSMKEKIEAGIFLIPEDRRQMGLMLDESVSYNIVFAAMQCKNKFLKYFPINSIRLVDKKAIKTYAENSIAKYSIKCSSINQKVSELSGGNQQKICFAKALALEPKVLVVNEPTRGMDISAKETVLNELIEINKDKGTTIIVASSELDELKRICDRIAVVYEGQIINILDPSSSLKDFALVMSGQGRVFNEKY